MFKSLRQPLSLPSWRSAARIITRVLAPPVCALCGAPGQWLDEPGGLDLCRHCELACPRWQSEPLPFDAAFCLFRYEQPVDQMITRLKFHDDLVFARVLGTVFARAWRSSGREPPECILPMALHRSRYQERGFCQTTEIARHIARRLHHPHGRVEVRTDLLRRVRATRAQSGLSAAQRAANLQGAFQIGPTRRRPQRVALLDDVLTTGHTALAAVAALHAAGIERVEVWCCARALRHEHADQGLRGIGAVQPRPDLLSFAALPATAKPAPGIPFHLQQWPSPTTSSPPPPPAAGATTTR